MRRPVRIALLAVALLFTAAPPAFADWSLLLFLGRTYPTFDDRLSFRIPAPSIPGVLVTVDGTPSLDADGGLTLGAVLAAEAGVIGVEGRIDSANVDFDVEGARYALLGVDPPLTGLTGSLSLADGRLDVNRLNMLSFNLRLRTPGAFGLVVSGGVSYLPSFTVSGSVPLSIEVDSPLGPITAEPRLRLVVEPDGAGNRIGVNAGAGLQAQGRRVGFIVEARIFAFRDYELRFASDDDLPFVNELVSSFEPVVFKPVIVTAQAGLVFRF